LDELRYQLEQKQGLVGRSTVDRMLLKLNPNRQKKHSTHGKGEVNGRNSNAPRVLATDAKCVEDLIFIDESNNWFDSFIRPFTRRAKERAEARPPKRKMFLGGCYWVQWIDYSSRLVSTDGLTFEAFIAQRLVLSCGQGLTCADGWYS